MAPALNRRERKKLQTREALITAAVRLFAERGFAATTIEDITEAADTSPRTFFRYFPTKEDLLVANIAGYAPLVADAFRPPVPEEPLHVAIRRATAGLVRAITGPDRLVQMQIILSTPTVMGRVLESMMRLEEALVVEIANRLGVDPDADPLPRAVAGAALGAARGAIHAWVATGGRTDPVSVVDRGFDLFDAGFATLGTQRPTGSGSS